VHLEACRACRIQVNRQGGHVRRDRLSVRQGGDHPAVHSSHENHNGVPAELRRAVAVNVDLAHHFDVVAPDGIEHHDQRRDHDDDHPGALDKARHPDYP
jgi:hypothetical protein